MAMLGARARPTAAVNMVLDPREFDTLLLESCDLLLHRRHLLARRDILGILRRASGLDGGPDPHQDGRLYWPLNRTARCGPHGAGDGAGDKASH